MSDATPDAFAPAAEHAHLRAYAQERGRADAVRHQDDLLRRRLPFADEIRALAQRRMGLLAARRAELITEAEAHAEAAEHRHRLALTERDAARHALDAEGVPSTERDLPPLERAALARALALGIAVAGLAGAAVLVLALRSDAPALWTALAALTALTPCAALIVVAARERSPAPEAARLTALRRSAVRSHREASEASAEALEARERVHTIATRAAELATAERALAGELLAAYVSAAFAALAPGALADSADFGAQPDVVPPRPEWVT
ncbi:hypothetical protein DVA67_020355 [Solirubrobacter sp. CPCC 204708]|uniref:DUF2207 domain-containing protein n=1 Tax=Solirubrobacter deserti TaxID=2282478 RepID=A0ABT4RU83_9ACTN|nr:hypothetical protein [Solirubrobacter deserti]MBE2318345.1 hypothetical protein [Solirubrobacter deserti]MDA0141943.1 hypothetical protein [Solirubrobacter deserti]